MTRIAILGAAHIHTPNFIKKLLDRSDIAVTTVWDHDTNRAKATADQFDSATTAPTSEAALNAPIDAVVICSETDRHESLVIPAAQAHKHMFVEKPLGLGAKDAFAMAAAINTANVTFQTGYFMRSTPAHQFLRHHINAGTFGKITRARFSNCHAGSLNGYFDTDYRWMAQPAVAGCGAFGDLGTHGLDILLWLVGPVTTVTAQIDAATDRYPDCDEYGEGILRFANNAIGTLAAGWVDIANPTSLTISGTQGHAHITNRQLYITTPNLENADGQSPWTDLPPALPHAFDLFLDAITGTPNLPLVTANEAAIRSAITEALYTAANTNTWTTPATMA